MRYTLNDVKQNAHDILVLLTDKINNPNRDGSAEGEIDIETAKETRNQLGAAFVMLGLITEETMKSIAKRKWSKAYVAAIRASKSWLCASSRLINADGLMTAWE